MNNITISSITGLVPPFSAYCCDYYGNQCSYVGSGTTVPITFTLTPQFISAPSVNIILIDSIGCQKVENVICGLIVPTPTASVTSTPTATPTITPTPTVTITNTPTNTITPTVTPTNTKTPTPTPTPTPTTTNTNTPTNTITPTQTSSETPTPTYTPTNTETPTPTNTETPTQTPTYTPTNTETPTVTPTNTETPTQTPTYTPTNTETPTQTPTVTPSSTMLNNYFATQCLGGGVQIVDANLLTGSTLDAFLGSDGNCWYLTSNQTVSAATITPLIEFGIYSGTGCNDCADYGCVTWEITDDGTGGKVSFTPCCHEPNLSPYDLPAGVSNICSKTQPVVLSGSPTIVNQGICPSCP
jgi:hypothetical protein